MIFGNFVNFVSVKASEPNAELQPDTATDSTSDTQNDTAP
jgi:hypothetical protein